MMSWAGWLALVLLAEPPRYTMSSVPVPDGPDERMLAGIDGDALLDLVVGISKKGSPRELRIHLQRPDGSFPPEPDRRVPFKSDVVAFGFADVREEPGAEVLLFTASSCFSYSTEPRAGGAEGLAGNARKLFSWDLLLEVPDPVELVRVGPSSGACGPPFLLPGPAGYGLFGSPAGPFGPQEGGTRSGVQLLASFPEQPRQGGGPPPRRRVSPFSITLSVDPFPDLVVTAPPGEEAKTQDLLEADGWLPAPALSDADGDSRLDVLYLSRGPQGRVLKIFRQTAAGSFPKDPSWSGSVADADRVSLHDLDGDARMDLIVEKEDGLDQRLFRLYRNRGGWFDVAKPDQVLKFSGYEAEAQVEDLDGDRRPELAVSSYQFPATSALTGGRVSRSLLLYRGGQDRPFEAKPAYKHEESFGAGELKGIVNRIDFSADLLGRGARDALYVDREGALAARRIARDLSLEDDPFFRFVPERLILDVKVVDANGDRRSDMVLRHARGLTILVSRP